MSYRSHDIIVEDDHLELSLQRAQSKLDVQSDEPIWTPARQDLWRRVEQHDFEPDTALNFTNRLARDHGWSLADARAAVDAYRRYCFLAVVAADHRITVTDQTPLTRLVGRPWPLSVSPNMTRQQFQKAVIPIAEQIQWRLRDLGYYPTHDQMKSFRMTVLPLVVLLMAFGMLKVVVGVERNHPVGILIFLRVLTAFAGNHLATYPRRTRAGKEAVDTYQASHARASRAPLDHELLLAVALSGAVVLSGTAYASVYAASRTMSSDGGSGCGGGGGGGGCGGCS